MSASRLTVTVTLALAATFGLVACGSDSGSESSGPKTLPKAEYITQADAVCREFNAKLEALPEPADKQSPQGIAGYLRQGADVADEGNRRLDAIGKPDADAALSDSFLAGQRETVTKARQIADQIDRGDVQGGAAALNAPDPAGEKSAADAKAFGFQACGSEG